MPEPNLPQPWRVRRHMVRQSMPGLLPYKPKSPALAAVMSALIPGLGQFYNGHFFKGLFFLFFSWMIFPYFIGIGDAYFSARRHVEFQERLLLRNLMTTVEEREYGPMPAYAASPLPARSETSFSELDQYQRNQRRCEKRIIAGGTIAGLGAALEVMAVFVGGGVALAVTGLIPLALGGGLFAWGWKKQKEWKQKREREEEKKFEKIVITIAQNKGGQVTVADLVAQTDLGLQEAEQILNKLVTKGYADIRVNDDGLITYHF
ncbi:hypothetical protein JXQ70_07480 [bacterium]|nr:hypothetical protein [bacterium]